MAAGVGLATVDRVLNGRQAVHPDTTARVMAALGRPRAAANPIAVSPACRIGVVLHKAGQAFYHDFAQELAVASAGRATLWLA